MQPKQTVFDNLSHVYQTRKSTFSLYMGNICQKEPKQTGFYKFGNTCPYKQKHCFYQIEPHLAKQGKTRRFHSIWSKLQIAAKKKCFLQGLQHWPERGKTHWFHQFKRQLRNLGRTHCFHSIWSQLPKEVKTDCSRQLQPHSPKLGKNSPFS